MMNSGTTGFGVDAAAEVSVGGEKICLSQLVAIAESLQRVRPNLFGFLQSFQSSHEEMMQFFQQMIRDDYDNYAQEMAIAVGRPTAPLIQHVQQEQKTRITVENEVEKVKAPFMSVNLPPPPTIRTTSEQEAVELAARLDAEEEEALRQRQRLEEEQAQALARLLEEEDQQEQRRKAQFFYCEICMDEEASIHGAITLDCDHRFCEECLSGFVCSKIESNEVGEEDLKCPRVDCPFFISHPTLRGLTEGLGRSEVYDKFLTFCTDKYLQDSIEAGGAMRCPSDNCNYVFQWRPEGSSFPFLCAKCNSQYCLNCSLVDGNDQQGGGGIGPGHAPLTCEQQREKIEQEAEEKVKFEEWKAMNAKATEMFNQMVQSNGWKRCPSCQSVIERTAGCDHMTCKTCKCNFCFVCGKFDSNAPTRRGDCGMTCKEKKK